MAERRSPRFQVSPVSEADRESDSDRAALETLDDVVGQVVEGAAAAAAGPSSDDGGEASGGAVGGASTSSVSAPFSTKSDSPEQMSIGSDNAFPPSTSHSSVSLSEGIGTGSVGSETLESVIVLTGQQMYLTVRIVDNDRERFIVRGSRPEAWDGGQDVTEELVREHLTAVIEGELELAGISNYEILGGSSMSNDETNRIIELHPISGASPPIVGGVVQHPQYAIIAQRMIQEWDPSYQVIIRATHDQL